jgi:hypothetical protein
MPNILPRTNLIPLNSRINTVKVRLFASVDEEVVEDTGEVLRWDLGGVGEQELEQRLEEAAGFYGGGGGLAEGQPVGQGG